MIPTGSFPDGCNRNMLLIKLRGVQLRIKRLCLKEGLTVKQLEDDDAGLSLLIQENELEDQLQSLDVVSRFPNRSHMRHFQDNLDNHDVDSDSIGSWTKDVNATATESDHGLHALQTVSSSLIPPSEQLPNLPWKQTVALSRRQTPYERSALATEGYAMLSPFSSNSTAGPSLVDPTITIDASRAPAQSMHSVSLHDTRSLIAPIIVLDDLFSIPSHDVSISVSRENRSRIDSSLGPYIRQTLEGPVDGSAAGSGSDSMNDTSITQPLITDGAAQQFYSTVLTDHTSPLECTFAPAINTDLVVPTQQDQRRTSIRPILPRVSSIIRSDNINSRPPPTEKCKRRKQNPRTSFKTVALRKETAQRRATGVCQRCRKDKKRCHINPLNPQGPCLPCLDAQTICIHWKIALISLFRDQAAPWPSWTARYSDMKRVADIGEWAANEPKLLQLSHQNPATGRTIDASYTIKVREFVPQPGDMLYQDWFDYSSGQYKYHPVQPYAVTSLDELAAELSRYINRNIVPFIVVLVGESDEILWRTYESACQRAEDLGVPVRERQLLTKVLRLWVTARIASLPENVGGQDKIADKIDDPSSPYHGTYPVAPVIYAQEEVVILTKIQRPLQQEILTELDAMMKDTRHETWFTLYLCLFVLAHSCTLTCGRDAQFATEVQSPQKYANPEAIHANVSGIVGLVTHFHQNGSNHVPFEMATDLSRRSELASLTRLGSRQLELLARTSEFARCNGQTLHEARMSCDSTNPFYLISQLFTQCIPQMEKI